MNAKGIYEVVDHTDVLHAGPRHTVPCSDDLVVSVFHRTTGGGRSVLLTRAQAAALRDWLARWLAEGWDGVPRRCGAAWTPGPLWRFECQLDPGHPGRHEGIAVGWPSGQDRNRGEWL